MMMDTYHGLQNMCGFSRDGSFLEIKVSSKIFHVYQAPLSGLIIFRKSYKKYEDSFSQMY
jgi:hypothetical protein